MSLRERLRRWRFRQRRAVGRALWLHGPFTRAEARVVGRQIRFRPLLAARLIRASRRTAHG